MDIQNQAHEIKKRSKARDIVYTPVKLAAKCVDMIDFEKGETIWDPAAGKGAFYDNFPSNECYCISSDITDNADFLKVDFDADWIVTNPPYSILNPWLERSCKIAKKGFAYLIGSYSLTPKRLELCEKYGFRISRIHLCKVSAWFGMTNFVVFEKGYTGKVNYTYDRTVWK